MTENDTQTTVATSDAAFEIESVTKDTTRASGVLAHVSSLPGGHGIGDTGAGARRFVDFLARARQRLWQIMPLGPTGFGDSPYAAFAAFAGNPLFISLDQLAADGLLSQSDLDSVPPTSEDRVDYGFVLDHKLRLLRTAFNNLRRGGSPVHRTGAAEFAGRQKAWLADYALFRALQDQHGGAPWSTWEDGVRLRRPPALDAARQDLADSIRFHEFLQYVFFAQWAELKRYANERGIRIVGDIPIFVAYDSSDVWANRELFHLDDDGNPTLVAGVPPDFFSPTGQRWGNPLYRWDVSAATGHAWWIERFRRILDQVDVVRIDHFRGFESYWGVPAADETAENGTWEPGPGAELFAAVRSQLGEVPIIVEDLGLITPEVEALRDELGFPGMKVLQFAFGGEPDHQYLPHNYEPNYVVYTGTHDNDTTQGWFSSLAPEERSYVQRYLGRDGHDISWDLIRAALASVAETAIVPLQDVLNLGGEARMNMPGLAGGNWAWRCRHDQIADHVADRLGDLTYLYFRTTVTKLVTKKRDKQP